MHIVGLRSGCVQQGLVPSTGKTLLRGEAGLSQVLVLSRQVMSDSSESLGAESGCRRSAGRGGCAAERAGEAGGGDGGRRGGGGSPAPLQCPRPPSHSLSDGNGQRGGAEEGAAGRWGGREKERIAAGAASVTLGRPATGRVPGGNLACGRSSHPHPPTPGDRIRPGAPPGRGVDPEASSRRRPRAARQNPAEEKPPPVSA